jgi:hypothetical protein
MNGSSSSSSSIKSFAAASGATASFLILFKLSPGFLPITVSAATDMGPEKEFAQ